MFMEEQRLLSKSKHQGNNVINLHSTIAGSCSSLSGGNEAVNLISPSTSAKPAAESNGNRSFGNGLKDTPIEIDLVSDDDE